MMFEKQCKAGIDKLAASSSNPDDPTPQSPSLPGNGNSEKDQEETGNTAAEVKDATVGAREVDKENQSSDGEPNAMSGSQSPPSKRPRGEDVEPRST